MRTANAIILIPARMSSTRLPGKPLADIAGKPMILHVVERACAAQLGPVVVATDSPRIADLIRQNNHPCVLTEQEHESGSDRIYEALKRIDPQQDFSAIINLQGDLPTIDPAALHAVYRALQETQSPIATLCTPFKTSAQASNPNTVKVVATPLSPTRLRALYFTRSVAPYGEGPLYEHIGIYAYQRAALKKFIGYKPTPLEKREKLEQLRALENNMPIIVEIVDHSPPSVDTQEDLNYVRTLLAHKQSS